jgi:hypothetical protein
MRALSPGVFELDSLRQSDDLAGLPDSVLAQVSPQTVERLRGALFRGQALRAVTSAVTEYASGSADAVRMMVSQGCDDVESGFEVAVVSSAGNWCCSSGQRITVGGYIWARGRRRR